MVTGSTQWQALVVQGAADLGIALAPQHALQFARYAEELETWNRTINLTAITDPIDVAVKHFLDALAPLPLIPHGARLLDIGSGAGFPGIPLKVVNPSLSVMLVDASRKKVNFQRHIIRLLGLKDIQARHLRAEEMGRRKDFAHAFDIVVSRAMTGMDLLASMAAPLLKNDGRIIAMKGPAEMTAAPADNGSVRSDPSDAAGCFDVSVKPYTLPFLSANRFLKVLTRTRGNPDLAGV